MPARTASAVLLAPVADVWAFVSEPYHLSDWWPGLATVRPDRRGFAVGARWVVRLREATLLRRADAEDVLVVHAVEPEARFAFELVRSRVRADLRLSSAGPDRTDAALSVSEPFRLSFTRGRLAEGALARLHDLMQTAAPA